MSVQNAKTSSIWRSIVTAAVITPSIAVLSLHAFLGGHTRLIADDFCSAYFARRLGLLRSIWYWYNNWSGRYTAFGMDWLMDKIGAYALPIIPPLTLLVWLVFTVLALHLSLRHVFSERASRYSVVALGAAFLFVVLLLSPHVPQSLYWWNAMRSYSLPLVFLTLYVILFQVGLERLKTEEQRMIGNLFSFLFLFTNGGLGETYVAFQFALLVALLMLEWFVHRNPKSSRFQFLFSGLIGTITALVFVVIAPGNTIRQNLYPPRPNLITLFQITAQSYIDFFSDVLQTPEKISGLLGAVLTAFWAGTESDATTRENGRLISIVFIGALLLFFASLVPGVYATSEPSAPRTIIIPVFIFVAGSMCAGFMLGQNWTALRGSSGIADSLVPGLAALLVVYAALVNGSALYNSRSMHVEFAKKWDAADAQILDAKARAAVSVTIPALNVPSGPGGDPTDNPNYWVNQCYSLYYGIQVFGPDPSLEQP